MKKEEDLYCEKCGKKLKWAWSLTHSSPAGSDSGTKEDIKKRAFCMPIKCNCKK